MNTSSSNKIRGKGGDNKTSAVYLCNALLCLITRLTIIVSLFSVYCIVYTEEDFTRRREDMNFIFER